VTNTDLIGDSYVKENWVGRYSEYSNAENMIIPKELEISWNTETSNFTYAKFKITNILYDDPAKY